MEKVISFKGNKQGNLTKLQNGMAYYSEDDNAQSEQETPNVKTCDIKSGYGRTFHFNQEQDQQSQKSTQPSDKNSKSKFSSREKSQHGGDQDEAELEDVQSKNKQQQQQAQQQKKGGLNLNTKADATQRFKDKQGNQRVVDSDYEAKNKQNKQDQADAFRHHPWRHLIFGNQVNENAFKKHLTLTYRGLVYAKKCLKGPSEKFIKTKQVIVPDSKVPKNRTLLLDLDETLIHSCSLKENPDHIVYAKSEYGDESKIGLKIRPYCLEFLQKLSQLWDIYIFTASSPAYATAIVNFLDPEAKYIIGILNRQNCMETKNGFFIKDLRILKNKSLKSMVLVDNLAHSFGFQIENGIPILEWHSDRNDTELKSMMSYLVEAAQVEDVRKFNRDRLRLLELAETRMEDLQI